MLQLENVQKVILRYFYKYKSFAIVIWQYQIRLKSYGHPYKSNIFKFNVDTKTISDKKDAEKRLMCSY